MYHTSAAGTHYYRVTDQGRSWADVLSGVGAFFSFGGRYNRIQQKTVYAADDPLVSISEFAFHQAIDWQLMIGGGPFNAIAPHPIPNLPLVSQHFLWCFSLNTSWQLVDVEDPLALFAFNHRHHEPLNPTPRDYVRTAALADRIRGYPTPALHHAGGIIAPSVRTVAPGYNNPRQQVFFVPPAALALPGTQVRRWNLTIEFKDMAGNSVNQGTRDIDWTRPQFRLTGPRTAVPGFSGRPPYPVQQWHPMTVKFA